MKFMCLIIAAFLLPLPTSLVVGTAWAETGTDVQMAKRINAANDLVRSGEYEQALANYSEVIATGRDQAQLDYNRGVALYRSGDIESAKTAFERASSSTESSLAANARYNLGNCLYTDASRIASQDREAAIQALQQAIAHYRGGLAANPNLADARANIELANEWIKILQQQEKQLAQQPNEEQQPGQEPQSTEEPQSNEEPQSSDASQQNADSKQSPADREQQPEAEFESSETPEEKTDPAQSNSEQPAADEQQSDIGSQDHAKLNDDRVGSAAERPADEQPKAEQQPPPTGDLTAADQAEEQPGEDARGEFDQKLTPMTREEAFKLLQSVRDRDMLRRLRQQQFERNQHIPTARDW